MKVKEMAEEVSPLTWNAVLDLVRNAAPDGFTNHEMAKVFETDYRRVASITKLMYEAGALSRQLVGRGERATALYFFPK
jgi:hypothetical protein